jgi:hypothetical protein
VTHEAGDKGLAVEALKGNPTMTPILRVDASKFGVGHHSMIDTNIGHPKNWQNLISL